ncbi:MAG TPA: hypothetical protein QGF58_07260 [Myxococcota bacterium]|nr:hypothetical protein [Myxococcota bacterium]
MVLFVWMGGCSSGPEQIDYVEQVTLYDQREVRPDAPARDGRGRLLPDLVVAPVESSDPTMVAVGDAGFTCQRSGVAVVTLQVQEFRKPVEVVCQLVGRIEVEPRNLQVVLELVEGVQEPVELDPLLIQVFDEVDNTIDVPVHVRSENDHVVAVGPGGVLEIRAPGRTTLRVRAGEQEVEIPVVVGAVVSVEAVAVAEGSIASVPIRPGVWAWTLRSDAPVTVEVDSCGTWVETDIVEGGCALPGGSEMRIVNRADGLRRVALRLIRMPD